MEDQQRAVHQYPLAAVRHERRRRQEFDDYAALPWRRIRRLQWHVAALYLVIFGLAIALLVRR